MKSIKVSLSLFLMAHLAVAATAKPAAKIKATAGGPKVIVRNTNVAPAVGSPVPTPKPSPSGTSTSTPESPLPTPTPTPSASLTPTPTPTQTPIIVIFPPAPPATEVPSQTPTPPTQKTVVATPVPTQSPTPKKPCSVRLGVVPRPICVRKTAGTSPYQAMWMVRTAGPKDVKTSWDPTHAKGSVECFQTMPIASPFSGPGTFFCGLKASAYAPAVPPETIPHTFTASSAEESCSATNDAHLLFDGCVENDCPRRSDIVLREGGLPDSTAANPKVGAFAPFVVGMDLQRQFRVTLAYPTFGGRVKVNCNPPLPYDTEKVSTADTSIVFRCQVLIEGQEPIENFKIQFNAFSGKCPPVGYTIEVVQKACSQGGFEIVDECGIKGCSCPGGLITVNGICPCKGKFPDGESAKTVSATHCAVGTENRLNFDGATVVGKAAFCVSALSEEQLAMFEDRILACGVAYLNEASGGHFHLEYSLIKSDCPGGHTLNGRDLIHVVPKIARSNSHTWNILDTATHSCAARTSPKGAACHPFTGIAAHEMAHTFFGLPDDYGYNDPNNIPTGGDPKDYIGCGEYKCASGAVPKANLMNGRDCGLTLPKTRLNFPWLLLCGSTCGDKACKFTEACKAEKNDCGKCGEYTQFCTTDKRCDSSKSRCIPFPR